MPFFCASSPDASHRSYSLLCLPALVVNEVYSKIAADLTLPPSAIFTTLSSIPTQWPKKGEVMIVVNPDTEKEKTFFPYDIVRFHLVFGYFIGWLTRVGYVRTVH